MLFVLLFIYVIYKIGKIVYKNLSNIKNRIGTPAAVAIGIVMFVVSFFLFDQLNSLLSIFFGMIMIGSLVFITAMILSVILNSSKSSKKIEKRFEADKEYESIRSEYDADKKSRKARYCR